MGSYGLDRPAVGGIKGQAAVRLRRTAFARGAAAISRCSLGTIGPRATAGACRRVRRANLAGGGRSIAARIAAAFAAITATVVVGIVTIRFVTATMRASGPAPALALDARIIPFGALRIGAPRIV